MTYRATSPRVIRSLAQTVRHDMVRRRATDRDRIATECDRMRSHRDRMRSHRDVIVAVILVAGPARPREDPPATRLFVCVISKILGRLAGMHPLSPHTFISRPCEVSIIFFPLTRRKRSTYIPTQISSDRVYRSARISYTFISRPCEISSDRVYSSLQVACILHNLKNYNCFQPFDGTLHRWSPPA